MLTIAQAEAFTADVISRVVKAQNVANSLKTNALIAATMFQARWRSFIRRKHFINVRESCLIIQRIRRGYVDRTKCQIRRRKLAGLRAERIFGASAAVIQRHYRGFYSRRYVHNYYARKAYLHNIRVRGDATIAVLREEQQALNSELESRVLKDSMIQFDTKASQMHHLVSTKAIPGVFNPRYPHPKPHAPDGELIEEGIKRITHDKLKKRAVQPSAPVTAVVPAQPRKEPLLTKSADAGRQRWLQGPFKPPAVLFEALKEAEVYPDPFDAALRKERLDAKLEKQTRIAPVDFVTRRTKPRPFTGSVNAASAPVESADYKLKKCTCIAFSFRDESAMCLDSCQESGEGRGSCTG